jgi:glycogen synthase
MESDNSWQASAKKYIDLYHRAIKARHEQQLLTAVKA